MRTLFVEYSPYLFVATMLVCLFAAASVLGFLGTAAALAALVKAGRDA